jgi:uncharacterized alkaline shock family protein YloU
MSILDRILLVLLTLGSLCASVFAFLLGVGVFGDGSAGSLLSLADYPYNVYTVVFSILFALISIRFLFYRTGSAEPDYVVLQGENGQIRISYLTIQQLANRTGRSIRGVQEFETRVRNGQAGVLLSTRVKAIPDVDLARVGNEIQQAVKDCVERSTGIVVERVVVNIAELANGSARSPKTWVE